MTGRMVHVAAEQPAPHVCAPPGEATCIRDGADPAQPVVQAFDEHPAGSLWRCPCSRLWQVDDFRLWCRADLVTRLIWRKVGRPHLSGEGPPTHLSGPPVPRLDVRGEGGPAGEADPGTTLGVFTSPP